MLQAFAMSTVCAQAVAQTEAKPPDPNDPRLTFSFPIQTGGEAFRFKVGLSKAGRVTGVSVFRDGETTPFQTLPRCAIVDMPEAVSGSWPNVELNPLLKHADLNFDGFEDLELLVYDIPHLDKKFYCIYLWDNNAGRFRYSNALSELGVNPVTHPENKTITMHEDWQGGVWTESTYRWTDGKPELIERNSLVANPSLESNEKCGRNFTCSRLINGKMITTLEKLVCTQEDFDNLPDCPAPAPVQALKADKEGSPAEVKK